MIELGEVVTAYKDKKGIPVFLGDLIKVFHFKTGCRTVFIYRKVLNTSKGVRAVAIAHLGEKAIEDCYSHTIEDCHGDFEIIDGIDINHPLTGDLVCWWERRQGKLPSLIERISDILPTLIASNTARGSSFTQPTCPNQSLDSDRGRSV